MSHQSRLLSHGKIFCLLENLNFQFLFQELRCEETLVETHYKSFKTPSKTMQSFTRAKPIVIKLSVLSFRCKIISSITIMLGQPTLCSLYIEPSSFYNRCINFEEMWQIATDNILLNLVLLQNRIAGNLPYPSPI